MWIEKFGSEYFVIVLDVNKIDNGWVLVIYGWLSEFEFGLFEFVDFYVVFGVVDFLCIDISKDGIMIGFLFVFYEDLINYNSEIKV